MFRIGILVSGGGTNAQAVIDAVESGKLGGAHGKTQVAIMVADRPCYALERAGNHGIPTTLVDRNTLLGNCAERQAELCRRITAALEEAKVDCIVLAGFLSILDSPFVEKWSGKIINIHPSLLPKFGGKGMYGMHVHRAVLEAGETVSGCTVHLVNAGVDTGDILLQRTVPVLPHDTPETLQQRVLAEEHPALVAGVAELIKRLEG